MDIGSEEIDVDWVRYCTDSHFRSTEIVPTWMNIPELQSLLAGRYHGWVIKGFSGDSFLTINATSICLKTIQLTNVLVLITQTRTCLMFATLYGQAKKMISMTTSIL